MPGLFGIYELGRRSMQTQQAALQVAGHNIANAATPGYHRQRVEMTPSLVEMTAVGALGTGVRIETIRRVEDRFLELSLQRETPLLSRYAARAAVLGEAETAFGEPTEGGMQARLEGFYDAWDDLASSPEDHGARESVVRQASALADSIRSTRGKLDDRRRAISGEIRTVVDDANRLLRELEDVNRGILAAGARGAALGDLADRRDVLVGTLGELIGAEATIDDDDTATVRLGGRTLLQAEIRGELAWDDGPVQAPSFGGRSIDAGETEGRLGGLLEARDVDLAESIRRLDEFAARLAADVNALHEGGVDANGAPGQAFFELLGVGDDGVANAAAVLRVRGALLQEPSKVAAGRSGKPGDNELALDVAALRARREGASALLEALVVDLGGRSREAADLAHGQSIVVDAVFAQRESISGVSLDEEGANLLRFQRSYQASAQLISIADELAQTVLSL